jgi:integrase
VDLTKRELHVGQRADRFGVISAPKSAASRRTVRLTPSVANVLREHKLVSKRTDGLVFARANGTPEKLVNIVTFGLKAAMIRAGVTEPALDSEGKPLIGKNGKPVLRAKFSGLHVLRHWHASFCSNRKEDGGLGLPPKMVQERLGHSSITITLDRFGHLFPRGDDHDEQEEALTQGILGSGLRLVAPEH